MPNNTGRKIILTLKKLIGGVATGETKPNEVGDPNYIAPVTDTTTCPPRDEFWCANRVLCTTQAAGVLEVEFSLHNAAINYPGVAKIALELVVGGTNIILGPALAPFGSNWFHFFQTGIPAGACQISILYLDSSNHELWRCDDITDVTIL